MANVSFAMFMLSFVSLMIPGVCLIITEYYWRMKRIRKLNFKIQYTKFVWVYLVAMIIFLLLGIMFMYV